VHLGHPANRGPPPRPHHSASASIITMATIVSAQCDVVQQVWQEDTGEDRSICVMSAGAGRERSGASKLGKSSFGKTGQGKAMQKPEQKKS